MCVCVNKLLAHSAPESTGGVDGTGQAGQMTNGTRARTHARAPTLGVKRWKKAHYRDGFANPSRLAPLPASAERLKTARSSSRCVRVQLRPGFLQLLLSSQVNQSMDVQLRLEGEEEASIQGEKAAPAKLFISSSSSLHLPLLENGAILLLHLQRRGCGCENGSTKGHSRPSSSQA